MNQKQIIIAQRGWVFVGIVSDIDGIALIEKAKNIRRWGTSHGLGQLAKEGPTSNTVLDDYGTVRLHPLSIVARIDVTTDKL